MFPSTVNGVAARLLFSRCGKKPTKKNEQDEQRFTIIYFDAFRYDYYDDPFNAISGAITEKMTSGVGKFANKAAIVAKRFVTTAIAMTVNKKTLKDVIKEWVIKFVRTIKKIFLPLLKLLSKIGLKKLGVDDAELQSFVSDISSPLSKEIINFNANQESIKAFRKLLAEKIKEMRGEKLVIVVDELDRCKPTFAVELLERIKHIFDVEGLVFLLSMNPEQMQETIKCVYGQGVDASTYLHKFIDCSMTLSTISDDSCLRTNPQGKFNSNLIDRHNWKTVIKTELGNKNHPCTLDILPLVLQKTTARTQEKIVQHLTFVLAVDSSSCNNSTFFEMLALLIAIRQVRPKIYACLKEGDIGDIPGEFIDKVKSHFRNAWEIIDYLKGVDGMTSEEIEEIKDSPNPENEKKIAKILQGLPHVTQKGYGGLLRHYIGIIEQISGIPE